METSRAVAWVQTDPPACRDDLRRLGLREAAVYNCCLAGEQGHIIPLHLMEEALRELEDSDVYSD